MQLAAIGRSPSIGTAGVASQVYSSGDSPKGRVFLLEDALHRAELSPLTRLVGLRILWHQGSSEDAWPSQDTLARDLGCTRETVSRAVKRLEEAGLLEVDERPYPQVNHYTVTGALPETDSVIVGSPRTEKVKPKQIQSNPPQDPVPRSPGPAEGEEIEALLGRVPNGAARERARERIRIGEIFAPRNFLAAVLQRYGQVASVSREKEEAHRLLEEASRRLALGPDPAFNPAGHARLKREKEQAHARWLAACG